LEAGNGAAEFVVEDQDASEGNYIVNMAPVSFEFNIPEAGEYTVWGRTTSPTGDQNSFDVKMDGDLGTGKWDVGYSRSWAWKQATQSHHPGPRIFTLDVGQHTLVISKIESGTKLDAIYITNNLSLWEHQIQQRFEMTMSGIEESQPAAVEAREKVAVMWGRLKMQK